MFRKIIDFIRSAFSGRTVYTDLEAFIAAHEPTGPADVERLEREFYRRQSLAAFEKYY